MGNKIIISKHRSPFDEILKLKKSNLEKIGYKTEGADEKKHLSLFEIKMSQSDAVVRAVDIYVEIKAKTIELNTEKSYIILVVQNQGVGDSESESEFRVPCSLETLVSEFQNFTERGLTCPFSVGQFDETLLYKIYLLNGKLASKELRAHSVVKALELENWLSKMEIFGLLFIFSGYFVDKTKIKSGNRINLVSNKTAHLDQIKLTKQSDRFVKELLSFNRQEINPDIQENILDMYFIQLSLETNTNDTLKDGGRSTLIFKPTSPKVNKLSKKHNALVFSESKKLSKANESASKKSVPKFNLDLGKLRLDSLSSNDQDSVGRETTRKMEKLDEYKELCSDVYQNNIFVSGYTVAKNLELLKSNKITHILNCAGDYCPNIHSKHFVYKTYYIKDTKIENIECVFYDAIEFIEKALESNGKILIHCVQGVSRSVTICSAYLIYKTKKSFDKVLDSIKLKRGIASPNIGFIAQLILFQKRVRNKLETSYFPKVFCFGSHQFEDCKTIVGRHVNLLAFR